MNGWIRRRQFIVVVFGKSMQVACEWLIREKYLSTSDSVQSKEKKKKFSLAFVTDLNVSSLSTWLKHGILLTREHKKQKL